MSPALTSPFPAFPPVAHYRKLPTRAAPAPPPTSSTVLPSATSRPSCPSSSSPSSSSARTPWRDSTASRSRHWACSPPWPPASPSTSMAPCATTREASPRWAAHAHPPFAGARCELH
eukprot:scaffold392_cov101-Isochrysis_galbana.AAC.8